MKDYNLLTELGLEDKRLDYDSDGSGTTHEDSSESGSRPFTPEEINMIAAANYSEVDAATEETILKAIKTGERTLDKNRDLLGLMTSSYLWEHLILSTRFSEVLSETRSKEKTERYPELNLLYIKLLNANLTKEQQPSRNIGLYSEIKGEYNTKVLAEIQKEDSDLNGLVYINHKNKFEFFDDDIFAKLLESPRLDEKFKELLKDELVSRIDNIVGKDSDFLFFDDLVDTKKHEISKTKIMFVTDKERGDLIHNIVNRFFEKHSDNNWQKCEQFYSLFPDPKPAYLDEAMMNFIEARSREKDFDFISFCREIDRKKLSESLKKDIGRFIKELRNYKALLASEMSLSDAVRYYIVLSPFASDDLEDRIKRILSSDECTEYTISKLPLEYITTLDFIGLDESSKKKVSGGFKMHEYLVMDKSEITTLLQKKSKVECAKLIAKGFNIHNGSTDNLTANIVSNFTYLLGSQNGSQEPDIAKIKKENPIAAQLFSVRCIGKLYELNPEACREAFTKESLKNILNHVITTSSKGLSKGNSLFKASKDKDYKKYLSKCEILYSSLQSDFVANPIHKK